MTFWKIYIISSIFQVLFVLPLSAELVIPKTLPKHLFDMDTFLQLSPAELAVKNLQTAAKMEDFSLGNILQDKSHGNFALEWLNKHRANRFYVKRVFESLKTIRPIKPLASTHLKNNIDLFCQGVFASSSKSYFNFISKTKCLQSLLVLSEVDSKKAFTIWERIFEQSKSLRPKLLYRANVSRNIYVRIFMIDLINSILKLHQRDKLLKASDERDLLRVLDLLLEKPGYSYAAKGAEQEYKGSTFTVHNRSYLELVHLEAGVDIDRPKKEARFRYYDLAQDDENFDELKKTFERSRATNRLRRYFHLNFNQSYVDFLRYPHLSHKTRLKASIHIFVQEYFFDLIIHYAFNSEKFHEGDDAIAPYNYFSNIALVARALHDLQKHWPEERLFVKELALQFLVNIQYLYLGKNQNYVDYSFNRFQRFENHSFGINKRKTVKRLSDVHHYEAVAYLLKIFEG